MIPGKRVNEVSRLSFVLERRFDLAPQLHIAGAGFIQKRISTGRTLVENFLKDPIYPLPSFRIHRLHLTGRRRDSP
ncbi:MAG: hypothetical protein HXY20_05495 [Acidobacteria bacterium]|nr:hypothetical protein [Acidobacteriota bacterium]